MKRTNDEAPTKSWGQLTVMVAEARAAEKAAGDALSKVAAKWVTPNYLLSLREHLTEKAEGAERFKLLRQAVVDAVAFQRGDFWSGWLDLEKERLKFQLQRHKDQQAAAAKLVEVAAGKRRDPLQPMSEEELKACVDKVDEIMGIK